MSVRISPTRELAHIMTSLASAEDKTQIQPLNSLELNLNSPSFWEEKETNPVLQNPTLVLQSSKLQHLEAKFKSINSYAHLASAFESILVHFNEQVEIIQNYVGVAKGVGVMQCSFEQVGNNELEQAAVLQAIDMLKGLFETTIGGMEGLINVCEEGSVAMVATTTTTTTTTTMTVVATAVAAFDPQEKESFGRGLRKKNNKRPPPQSEVELLPTQQKKRTLRASKPKRQNTSVALSTSTRDNFEKWFQQNWHRPNPTNAEALQVSERALMKTRIRASTKSL